MKKQQDKRTGIIFAVGLLILAMLTVDCFAQTKKATTSAAEPGKDVTESLGVGLESRFNSGRIPIAVDRVNIIPGTPMTVKPTMDNMLGTGKKTFGGILGRYDTANFGKFFGVGGLTPQQAQTRTKTTNISVGDNKMENRGADQARMYPPRLYIDTKEMPVSTAVSLQVRQNVQSQVKNVLAHLSPDYSPGRIELVFQGDCLILRGEIRSKDHSQTLENVLAMEPGIDRIENQLKILEP